MSQVAHTSRFWRSIRRGCIPVAWYRGYARPFESSIDYASFTLDIDPSAVDSTFDAVRMLVGNPQELARKQAALQRAQDLLMWERPETQPGIAQLFLLELERRAIEARRYHGKAF